MSRRRRVFLALGLVGVVALSAGLAWFQPWKLFIDHRVNETLPAVALEPVPAADVASETPAVASPTSIVPSTSAAQKSPAAPKSKTPATPATPDPKTSKAEPQARLLSRGDLISHEHSTSGAVSVVQQPDGSRVLAIANLNTSDGPDVKIWLTDAPVIKGSKGWYVFDDGAHVSLGSLKGNLGNQVYKIPASADLSKLTSVSLWCARFDVSFGAAELNPA